MKPDPSAVPAQPAPREMRYSEIEAELKTLPMTWVPALLRVIVHRAVEVNVFVPGGLAVFVQNAETRAAPESERAPRDGKGPNNAHRCPACHAFCVCAEWYDGDDCYHHTSVGCVPRDESREPSADPILNDAYRRLDSFATGSPNSDFDQLREDAFTLLARYDSLASRLQRSEDYGNTMDQENIDRGKRIADFESRLTASEAATAALREDNALMLEELVAMFPSSKWADRLKMPTKAREYPMAPGQYQHYFEEQYPDE